DIEIGQIQPVYVYHLGQYQKILKQRNVLLKDDQKNKEMDRTILRVLTEQLIEHAAPILQKRFEFLNLLRNWAVPIHESISRNVEKLDIKYSPSVNVSEDMELSKILDVNVAQFQDMESKEIE